MAPELDTILLLLGGLCVAWLAATWVVALGAVRLGERLARRPGWQSDCWLPSEAWLALAASGAAVGGFVAYTTAAAWDLGAAGWPGSIAPIMAVGMLGMIAGAALACLCAAGYLWGVVD